MSLTKQKKERVENYEANHIPWPVNVPNETPINLYRAIAGFQAEVPILIQNTKGYNYTYVDLAEIVRVITPILKKHGLAYIQPLVGDSEIETILFHVETGESIKSRVKIPVVELDRMNLYQSMGSAISYFRRYSISSMLNLISEKDNDAAGKQSKAKISDKDFETALEYIQKGDYTIEKLLAKYQLTKTQNEKLLKWKN